VYSRMYNDFQFNTRSLYKLIVTWYFFQMKTKIALYIINKIKFFHTSYGYKMHVQNLKIFATYQLSYHARCVVLIKLDHVS